MNNIIKVIIFALLFSVTSHANYSMYNPTGNRVGGGKDYSNVINKENADYIVKNRDELLEALSDAVWGDIIYVKDDASIDLSGIWDIEIRAGLTIASGRGQSSLRGGRIFTKTLEKRKLFLIKNGNVRITGLRLEGPTAKIDLPGCERYEPDGIFIKPHLDKTYKKVEIDNNEIYQWPSSGVHVSQARNVEVHHNYFHHNLRRESEKHCKLSSNTSPYGHGLGYGIVVNRGAVNINANYFSNNRHNIAGTGLPGTSYTARFNISEGSNIGHYFDMHGCQDRPEHTLCADQPQLAGESIIIENNLFLGSNYPSIVLRGQPSKMAVIRRNKFVNRKQWFWSYFSSKNKSIYFKINNKTSDYKSYFRVSSNSWRMNFDDIRWKNNESYRFGIGMIDLNGDRMDEMIERGYCGVNKIRCWRVYKWIFNNKLKTQYLKAYNYGDGAWFNKDTKSLNIIDYNNDGLEDIEYIGYCGKSRSLCRRLHINNGKSFNRALIIY